MIEAIISGVFAAVWAVVEPLLLWAALIGAGVTFAFGILAMMPVPRFKAIAFFLGTALALGAAGFLYGQKAASREVELAAARARIEAMERDVAIAEAAEAEAERQAEEQAAYAKSLETQVTDYEQALATRPDAACTLNDDDLQRLRRIGR